jgi:hypothetical protein
MLKGKDVGDEVHQPIIIHARHINQRALFIIFFFVEDIRNFCCG